MHRFVWDLHYAPPESLGHEFPISAIYHDTPKYPLGAWALPGKYTAKLTADGKSYTQPLVVKMDPRVKTSAEDLTRQFEISSQLAAAYAEASAASRQAEQLLTQMEALGGKFSEDASLAEALSSLSAKVRGMLGPQREVFGFALASSLSDPTVGYPTWDFSLLSTVAFFGLAWSGISLALGLRTKSAETVFGIAGTLTFPLLFMSTALMRQDRMPPWMANVSSYNPISIAVNAIRDLIMNGYLWGSFSEAYGVIALIGLVTLGATFYEFRKVVS